MMPKSDENLTAYLDLRPGQTHQTVHSTFVFGMLDEMFDALDHPSRIIRHLLRDVG